MIESKMLVERLASSSTQDQKRIELYRGPLKDFVLSDDPRNDSYIYVITTASLKGRKIFVQRSVYDSVDLKPETRDRNPHKFYGDFSEEFEINGNDSLDSFLDVKSLRHFPNICDLS